MEVKRPKLGCNVYFRVMLAVNCSAASVVVNSLWVVWPLASWWQQTGTHYLYCHYFKCWTRYRGERGPYAPNWAPRSRIGQMEKNSLEGQRGDFSGVETPSAECLLYDFTPSLQAFAVRRCRCALWVETLTPYRVNSTSTATYILLTVRSPTDIMLFAPTKINSCQSLKPALVSI